MIEITKDLIGKQLVYYGASGFAVCYGEIIDVNEKDELISVIDGIDKSNRYFGKYNVALFETEEAAVKEYEEYLLVEG